MDVLFAVGAYWPSAGGVQMVTQYIAEGLAEKGHKVYVVTQWDKNYLKQEVHNNVEIVRFYERSFGKIHFGDKTEYQKYIIEMSKQVDAIVVVCSNNFVAQWIYPIMDDIKCKKVLYQHGMYDGRFHFDNIHSVQRMNKHILLTIWWEIYHRRYWNKISSFDDVIHLFKNDSSYNYFQRRGYKNNHVVMNSCQDVFFDSQMSEGSLLKYEISTKYFIYVANYCSRKNQRRAVELFFNSNCEACDLVLIGSEKNSYYDSIVNYINNSNSLKKERIHLLTDVPRDETIQLIKNAFACLFTSENEYFPISIIEAMAANVPFISTNVGVCKYIPGGQVCDNDDELIYWMEYFCNNPEYVDLLGKIARSYAEKNCLRKNVINNIEKILFE